ncbi:MAG: hypothetical protein KF812_12250 [Fimbriimonadaceae bacterium]|nr:hypothetical protein [Fimbriimonadaceae bacterium]
MKTIRGKMPLRKMMRDAAAEFPPQCEIAFLAQDWDDAFNSGGLFRTADACGAAHVFLTGRTPTPDNPQVHRTSMGHHRRVSWSHHARWDDATATALEDGWTLVAVEIAEGAVPYFEFEFPERACLVLGNEERGVYSSVMKSCAGAVMIPMAGKGRSLNVAVSGAVIAFHARFGVISKVT